MSKSTQQELWRLVNPGDSFLPGDQHWSWQHSEWLPVPSLYYAREVQEGAGPVRRRMKSAEARREYDAALPALLQNMRISSAAESALDSVTGPDGANDMKSQRTGKISPNQNGDTQSTGVLPGAAAEDVILSHNQCPGCRRISVRTRDRCYECENPCCKVVFFKRPEYRGDAP